MSEYYKPHRSTDWNYGGRKFRLSRSKLELFMECPRCFFIDNKLGTARPRGPSFTINVAIDALLKKEFDIHRLAGKSHPLMQRYGVDAVPFDHPKLPVWRDNFKGIEFKHEPTGFTVSGAVDDIWINPKGELIVVDYKATSKEGTIETLSDSSWEKQYRRQIGVYQWLLKQNGFAVSDTGYFVYANAGTDKSAFDGQLEFEVTLVPCNGETDWVETALQKAKQCLENSTVPDAGPSCDFCAYRQAAGEAIRDVFAANKVPATAPKAKARKKTDGKKDDEKTASLF